MLHRARAVLVTFGAASAAGCQPLGDTATVDAFSPTSPPTGIYTLTATTLTDTCDPPRFTGTLTVPVIQSGDDLGVFDGSTTAQQRYDLLASTGYTLDIPKPGEQLDPCGTTAGDSVAISYVLTSATADQIGIVNDEQWTIATACSLPADPVGIPVATCHATRTLRYDLVQECDAPCKVTTPTTTTANPDAGVGIPAPICQCD